ncbi:MAG: hypothetical protein R3F46_12270 [bacterium]
MADNRNCPKCDTLMEYRLGEYECPGCGHTEGSAQSVSGVHSGRGLSGPGFQEPVYPPGQTPPASQGGYRGYPEEAPRHGLISDGLSQEKWFIIGFYIFQYLLMGAMAASGPRAADFGGAGVIFTSMLVISLIGAGILFFVLHSNQSWLKFCCMGCVGIGLISQIFTLFAPGAMRSSGMLSPTMELISTVLGLIYAGWLVSILYRDTQQQY